MYICTDVAPCSGTNLSCKIELVAFVVVMLFFREVISNTWRSGSVGEHGIRFKNVPILTFSASFPLVFFVTFH
uniref:Uncharacterized protein n=1 Tax=Arundo donax TaxID=35708 RepID=A0A0A9EHL4_ARUDO